MHNTRCTHMQQHSSVSACQLAMHSKRQASTARLLGHNALAACCLCSTKHAVHAVCML